MSKREILEQDSNSVTTIEDKLDGTATVTKTTDVGPILEQNKQEYNSGANNPTHGPVGRKVASIPLVVWQRWMRESKGEIQRDPAVLAKYLNDPDNKFFRTHNSRV